MTSGQTLQGIGQPNTTVKPKVRRVDHDGLFAGIEFTHSSGERVSASFTILAWVHAPKEMLDRTKIVLTRGYFTMVGPDFVLQRKKRKKRETARLEAYAATKLRNLKRPKVIEMDDDFAIVEFTQANGERVSAEYRRSGWVVAPGFVIAEVQKALARGFRTVMGPRLSNR